MFNPSAHRINPYNGFHIQLSWDGRVVAAFKKMSALKMTTEVTDYRATADGETARKLPGPSEFDSVSFEVGLTHDRQFLAWANQVNNPSGSPANSPSQYHKTIQVLVLNMRDRPVMAFSLIRAWVSEFQATPEMDANSVAIQSLKIEFENVVRDGAVAEPDKT